MATVTISQGALRGGISNTESGYKYYEFLGIPYAKPPIGEFRFKSPQCPEKWENERDATSIGTENIATQVDFMTGKLIGSEDCLYLNVYTPKLPEDPTKFLPVVVHLHGGGFVSGNGTIKGENGPDYLIEQNVVVVAINYRLNFFGFMSLDIPEAAGNMGLKDQVKALEWVKNNIEYFGGDKNNITLMGISAGSASAEYLILSPLAKGLFHKAILRSGSALNHWAINYDIVELTVKIAQLLGYKNSIEDKQAIREFLMKIPEQQLVGASFKITETSVTNRVFFGFVPSIEKDFGNNDYIITTDPYKLFKEGNFNNIPVIRGFCSREGSLMSMMKPHAMKSLIENKNFLSHWSHNIDANESDLNKQLSNAYLSSIKPDDEENKFAEDFFSDYDFVAGILIGGKLSENQNIPQYLYRFSYGGKLNMFKVMYGLMKSGAIHGDDFTYTFRHDLASSDNTQDIEVRNKLTRAFAAFAKNGNPAADEEVPINWPASTEGCRTYLNIDAEFTVESDYEPNKIAIYEEVLQKNGRL